MPAAIESDAAVVGAGLAGVVAANELERDGLSVALIEAREEVGGRTRSRAIAGRVVELGGTFLSRRQWRLASLAREHGLTVRWTGIWGRRIRWLGPRSETVAALPRLGPRELRDLVSASLEARRLARAIDPEGPWRSSGAAELDRQSVADWLERRQLGGTGRWIFATAIGGYASQPVERLSLLEFLWWMARYRTYLRAALTGSGYHIVEGAQEVSRRLARRLSRPPVLETPIDTVHQTEGAVELHSRGHLVCSAKRAVVTVPLATVDRIAFEPPLDEAQAELHATLRPGPMTKLGAVALAPVEVTHRSVIGGAPLTWTAWMNGQLTGYGLQPARDKSREELLEALAGDFDLGADRIRGEVVDWSAEPYARGAYVAFEPGQITRHGPHLRRPHRRVHFAGAERSSMPQQMEGAVESGAEEAARVADALRNDGRVATRRP